MIGFLFLLKREIRRFMVIIHQALTPAIVSALLYFVVFGQAVGTRIGQINGSSYLAFIVPGLIMLNAIITTYTTTSMSIFMSRRFKNIDDLLIAPLSYLQIVLAYVLSGVVRGTFIAAAIFIVSLFFIHP